MHHRTPAILVAAVTLLLTSACSEAFDGHAVEASDDGLDDSFLISGKADGLGVSENSAEACGVLRLVNEASMEELDFETGLDRRAASGIVSQRPIDSLKTLDAVPYVGPSAFGRLLAYAPGGYDCSSADPAACSVLRAANEATFDELDIDAGLDRRAAAGIVDARPLRTLEALDAVSYVGRTALASLSDYAEAQGLTCEASCRAAGGRYDGIDFTAAEECRAVDFMNHARLSQMSSVGNKIRRVIYDCEPTVSGLDCAPGRNRLWTSIGEVDSRAGQTSMRQIKAAAASWVDDGVDTDTIASTRENRAALVDVPVGFDGVFMVRKNTRLSHSTRLCYELRDSAGASKFMTGCVALGCTDCGGSGLDRSIGQQIALRGTVKSYSFGHAINIR